MVHFSDSPTNVENIVGRSEVLEYLQVFLISSQPHTCCVILAHLLYYCWCVERW